MRTTIKLVVIVLAFGLLVFGFVGESLVKKVPLGQVGVRTQKVALFGKQGVVEHDYGPGWHRNIWFIDEWDLFDSTVQTFHMAQSRHPSDQSTGQPFQLKSHDGYSVNLDVTIKYRIRQGLAHSVLVHMGRGDRYHGFVARLAQDACRSAFGVMRTEAFYHPQLRAQATERARTELVQKLKESDADVDIIDLLIRDVKFDEQYERKIKDKKLADQDIDLNHSKGLAAQQKGLTNKIAAETEAMVKVIEQTRDATLMKMRAETDQQVARITADYQKYVTETRADADLFAAEKAAAGLLLVKKAEAAGEEMRNKALAGPGGAMLAALEAAKAVTIGEVTFSTLQLDPLDLNAVMKRLGVPSTATSSR